MLSIALILTVFSALVLGAVWGLYFRFGDVTDGVLIAIAAGALIVSAMSELIEPASAHLASVWAMGWVAAGASIFTTADWLVDRRWGPSSGGGLLLAVTFDGVPENLALGAVLAGSDPSGVAALAAAIFLSNLPEAAGGAKAMRERGFGRPQILMLWTATAGILAAAALLGHFAFAAAPPAVTAALQCFAAGAIVASLAIEIMPRAFRLVRYWPGIAVAAGLIVAFLLDEGLHTG